MKLSWRFDLLRAREKKKNSKTNPSTKQTKTKRKKPKQIERTEEKPNALRVWIKVIAHLSIYMDFYSHIELVCCVSFAFFAHCYWCERVLFPLHCIAFSIQYHAIRTLFIISRSLFLSLDCHGCFCIYKVTSIQSSRFSQQPLWLVANFYDYYTISLCIWAKLRVLGESKSILIPGLQVLFFFYFGAIESTIETNSNRKKKQTHTRTQNRAVPRIFALIPITENISHRFQIK